MPRDDTNLVELVKRAALAAIKASKPVAFLVGTVIAEDPLQIETEQKMLLEAEDLILTRQVTNYTVEMTVDHTTEAEADHVHIIQDTYTGGGESLSTSHLHDYRGRKAFLVHNALKTGEKVILQRWQGNPKYVVLDRVGVVT